ncbi:flavin reductase [Amycolatopsis sp. K13G38]|uniref:Flavin reductase n=1 Tax=Amycolatopsis acididurans TaxID=2724524 RepID=A0ABX1J292_9PSEU|nr:flavin reductase family protein [Amycolatopsis acididurans]NKQ52396.1 flavin reductase [Amycolatopsis acididurans]
MMETFEREWHGESDVDGRVQANPSHALGYIPSGVVVVATMTPEGPVGSASNSVTPISLDPPLVAFFAADTSPVLAAVRESGRFTVNVLAADQAGTYDRFRRGTSAEFDQAGWEPVGQPRLRGAVAVLHCDVLASTPVGGRVVVVGRVRGLGAVRPGADPLLACRGALHGLAHTPPDHPHYRVSLAL